MMTVACLWLALGAGAAVPDALAEAAGRFRKGDAAGAADAYESALADGADGADVYFNLGTSALKAGDLGRAVWALSEARTRAPWDEDVSFNLSLARRQNVDTLVGADEPWWQSVLFRIPRAPLQWLSWLVFVLTCALLTARSVVGPHAGLERWCLRGGASTALLGLTLVGVETVVGAPSAVVMDKEVIVRATPDPDGPEAFKVHAGLSVRLVDGPGLDMTRIRLTNGLEGYVPAASLRALGAVAHTVSPPLDSPPLH